MGGWLVFDENLDDESAVFVGRLACEFEGVFRRSEATESMGDHVVEIRQSARR